MRYDKDFWNALDYLVSNSTIIIDRPKGSTHPKYTNFIYVVDYGYLSDTSSSDSEGIDIWKGSSPTQKVNAVICTVDLKKKDSEIKILIGCTNPEIEIIYNAHNSSEFMKGILIIRE
ncbi:inorganic pyrophosphatase [Fusobacterium sp.]|uniref:inorganic pyrophosphatase n=1 Tax=Fusobacterium sp. TaxID=68766 RepID=UPI00290441F0|nr:inorganic pyrophosphatase [Fusobacterium sp.]MDU1912023.1 inorganic pyrophosphatase [Fusobacterium sp.]